MAGGRKSIAGEIFQGFLEGVAKALAEKEEARKQAARDAEAEQQKQNRWPQLGQSVFGQKPFDPRRPRLGDINLTSQLLAAAKAREAEDAKKARAAEANDLHWDLLATDPEYRAASARREQDAQIAAARLRAKQDADLQQMRALSAYGRDKPVYGREECTTCDGRGDYISKHNRIVGCLDCAGCGWRRKRY